MTELRDLYQEVILDHHQNPRNFRVPAAANRSAEGNNPLCGDHVLVMVSLRHGVVEDIGFQGGGCAICTASASTMTEAVLGKSPAQIGELFESFHALVTRGRHDAEVS